jgi:hypothetical protein
MDLEQTDHLKAYGITFNALEKGIKADWLLNYRGGSFLLDYSDKIAAECRIEGVSFHPGFSFRQAVEIYSIVQDEDNNMDVISLKKRQRLLFMFLPDFSHGMML